MWILQTSRGYITLNGVNIEELDRDAYLKLFSVVFQDFKIFAFPVGENVAASTEYDENRVWQSLNLAGLDEKIRRIPKQLNQYVNKNVDVEELNFRVARSRNLQSPGHSIRMHLSIFLMNRRQLLIQWRKRKYMPNLIISLVIGLLCLFHIAYLHADFVNGYWFLIREE